MNLAIIISVMSYNEELDRLPACGSDGTAMFHLLNNGDNFDEVLQIDGNQPAQNVKDELDAAIKKHSESDLNQVLLYFSGHGVVHNDEFFYCLSNYSEKRRKSTSLENSIIDDMFRSLSPNIFIKIVDACYSGVQYIKGQDGIEDVFSKSKSAFKDLCFMYSSQTDKRSYQDNHMSYFTESVVRSVISHTKSEIKYRDVMAFVADDFEYLGHDKPYLVQQGTYQDVFCKNVEAARAATATFLRDSDLSGDDSNISKDSTQISMLAIIETDAKRYASKQEAHESLGYISEYLRDQRLEGPYSDFFEFHISEAGSINPPQSDVIGRWIEKNSSNEYFARPIKRIVKYQKRELKDPLARLGLSSIALAGRSENDYHMVTASREEVTDYEDEAGLPFSYLLINANSLFPNIASVKGYAAPIVSATRLCVFLAETTNIQIGYDGASKESPLNWYTLEVDIKQRDQIRSIAAQIWARFHALVQKTVDDKVSALTDGSKTEHLPTDSK